MSSPYRLSQIPIRIRLTIWYLLVLALILSLFALLLYFQVRGSLISQVDAALELAANQALLGVVAKDGELSYQLADENPEAVRRMNDDFVIRILAEDGTIVTSFSSDDETPQFSTWEQGFATLLNEGDDWRVFHHRVEIGRTAGWLQVAQELDPVYETLARLRGQILWALPLALFLAGIGGYFLAGRTLRPIVHITQTAQSISASDLDKRIQYQGPKDEVGQLATTFDKMLERLETAFKRERRFTSDAAHELRTPLTALKGRIGVTLSQERKPVEYRDTLQEMEGQVDRLIRLSNDLLFIARLDQGQFNIQSEEIHAAELIGSVLEQLQPAADTKAISVTVDISPDLIIRGNLDLLIRLFLNLLDNAVKYTSEAGQIEIRGTWLDGRVQISISDTGPGIASKHLDRLFERFYRIEGDRSRNSALAPEDGAGLGLAIAYEIVRFHGGNLLVQSEVGQGTQFIVDLNQGTDS